MLACDLSRIAEEIRAVEEAGADLLHFDVMDGHFVPNITFGLPVLESARRVTELPFDVHLMMSRPELYLEAFVDAGSDFVTVHVEACGKKLPAIASKIRKLGARPGVAINPETPFGHVSPYLDCFDLLLIMTVHPGFGGQKFIPAVLPKIRRARRWIRRHRPDLILSVDGGIDRRTARLARSAGVNLLVAGSSVFGESDYATAIRHLRKT